MSNNYWAKRFEKLKDAEMKHAEMYADTLKQTYLDALEDIRRQIDAFYIRYARENIITYAQAKEKLDIRTRSKYQLKLESYIKLAEKNNLPKAHLRMLKNASLKVRITRLQALYIDMAQTLEMLAKTTTDGTETLLSSVYEESTYKTAYELRKYIKNSDWKPNTSIIKKAINTPWIADAQTFSDRIWTNKTKLISELQKSLTQSFIASEPIGVTTANISKAMDVSYSNARRLVETETAYFCELAMNDTFHELGVEQYEIVATLDRKTSKICRRMDGKVFDLKDLKVGINAPPFHCYCRTTKAPYLDYLEGETRASRGDDGKTKFIDNMTYNEWLKAQ